MTNSTAQQGETPSTFWCGACKVSRKKCSENCVLAPYFPLDDPQRFLSVHRVFGKGHVIKLLQDIPVERRGDAVSSMVYEASQRLRDPVYGCVGEINDLHKKVAELKLQLDSTQSQLANISLQHANLLSLVTNYHEALVTNYHEGLVSHFYDASLQESEDTHTIPQVFHDVVDPLQLWEAL